MPRKGENIYKRKDGRWEGRYIKDRTPDGKAIYGYLYAHSYRDLKSKMIATKQKENISEKKETVLRLSDMGMPIEQIAQAVKIAVEDVQNWLQESSQQ